MYILGYYINITIENSMYRSIFCIFFICKQDNTINTIIKTSNTDYKITISIILIR